MLSLSTLSLGQNLNQLEQFHCAVTQSHGIDTEPCQPFHEVGFMAMLEKMGINACDFQILRLDATSGWIAMRASITGLPYSSGMVVIRFSERELESRALGIFGPTLLRQKLSLWRVRVRAHVPRMRHDKCGSPACLRTEPRRWVCGDEPGLRIAGPLTHTHRHGGERIVFH